MNTVDRQMKTIRYLACYSPHYLPFPPTLTQFKRRSKWMHHMA